MLQGSTGWGCLDGKLTDKWGNPEREIEWARSDAIERENLFSTGVSMA